MGDEVTILRVMPDYWSWPLWYTRGDRVGMMRPSDLPISPGLATSLEQWGNEFTDTFNQEDPSESGFQSPEELQYYVSRGWELARQLGEELGPDSQYLVVYQDIAKNRIFRLDGQEHDVQPPNADEKKRIIEETRRRLSGDQAHL